MIRDDWDFFVNEFFDISEILPILCITESERYSTCSCSTSSTDSVNIGLRDIRNIIVDDMCQEIDIDATSRDISRDKYSGLSVFEIRERSLSSILGFISMDSFRSDIFTDEIFHYFISSMFRSSEYKDRLYTFIFEDMEKKIIFITFVYKKYRLCNDIDCRRNRSNTNMFWIMQDCFRKSDNLIWHRRWEEKSLSSFWNELEKFSDIMDESHIEHSISFIKHENLDMSEVDISLTDKVEKSPWSRDENIDSFRERICLFSLSDTTIDDSISDSAMSSVCSEALSNLDSEFSSRSKNECFDFSFFCWIFFRIEKLENRYRESSRFSSSGLSTAEKISSWEYDRNGLFLDGSRSGISLFLYGFEDRIDKLERWKRHLVKLKIKN